MDPWLKENMHTIMMFVGAASLIGVAGIFVTYFIIKRRIHKKKNYHAE